MATCKFCDSTALARGMCKAHYDRYRRGTRGPQLAAPIRPPIINQRKFPRPSSTSTVRSQTTKKPALPDDAASAARINDLFSQIITELVVMGLRQLR